MSEFDRSKRTRVEKMALPQKNRGAKRSKAKPSDIVDLGARGGYRADDGGGAADYKKISGRHASERQELDNVESLDNLLGKIVRIGGLVLILAIFATLGIMGFKMFKGGKQEVEVDPAVAANKVDSSNFGIDLEKMEATLKSFFNAESIEERLQYVRNPDDVRILMESFYENRDSGPIGYEASEMRVGVVNETYTGSGEIYCMTVVNLEGFITREVALEVVDGVYLVDWPSFVGYSEMFLEEFTSKQPQEPVLMRLMAKRDDYFNRDFSDEEKYGCLRLYTADLENRVHAYYELNTEKANRVDRAFEEFAGVESIYVVVRISYPEEVKDKSQVLLDEILTNSWVDIEGRDLGDEEISKLDVLLEN